MMSPDHPPILRAAAHATLLDLSEAFRGMEYKAAADMITRLLTDFTDSGAPDMHRYTISWLGDSAATIDHH